MRDLSTQVKTANPIREWKLPEHIEAGEGGLKPSPISLLGIAPSPVPLHGLMAHAVPHSAGAGLAIASAYGHANGKAAPGTGDPEEAEEGRGKLGPHLKLLLRMVEDQPRAKIKDFYLTLKDRGYIGSYDLVKKKIHAFRRELGRNAGSTFLSTDAPHAQVEMAKLVLKGSDGQGQAIEVKAHLFTMVLGNSGRFYAELIEGSDMGSFLQCHQNAFEFFGGVPVGVFYDPQESPTMRRLVGGFPFHLPVVDCGHHYGYAAQPTPAFAPWMKGRLKRPGKVLKKLFFPGYEFTSLEKANADMLEWMAWLGRQNQIRERKEKTQREKLGMLPAIGFNFRGRRQFLKLRA
ncbi:MAG: hypothetical protein JWP91_2035 [Fibrobacteres bacterium]|nr:hypothetical protein [Fibrobacterota bacterium]